MENSIKEYLEKYANKHNIKTEDAEKHLIIKLYSDWYKDYSSGKIKNK